MRRARSEPLRELRDTTLSPARSFIALPHDELVAERLAVLLSAAREQKRMADAMDAIVAATALVHDLVIWTQDDDFQVLAELAPDLRVKHS